MSNRPQKQGLSDEPTVKALHLFATIGSLTERGGRITSATSGLSVDGLGIARVGDVVTYRDGSEAAVIDGAGFALMVDARPVALVESRLSNGDVIVDSLQDCEGISEYEGDPIEGLFDSIYVPSLVQPSVRFAVKGATTARGGVIRAMSSQWHVNTRLGSAACLGDVVHYPDGSTAKIISGVGDSGSRAYFASLAIVGSDLDNGDVISDSPDQVEHPTIFVPVKF